MKAKELRAWRKERGLTQKSFASLLHVSRAAVAAWENESNPVPHWVREKLMSRQSLNPVLDYDTFKKAQEKATAEGKTLDEWIAALIKKSLLLILFVSLARWPFCGSFGGAFCATVSDAFNLATWTAKAVIAMAA